MIEQFICRNGHRWGLSLEGGVVNERWVYCPACGAPPKPGLPMSKAQRLRRCAQRNPAVIALLASIFVMAAAFALLATRIWRDV